MGKECTIGIINGIKIVTDLIRPTYGGAGTNVIVGCDLFPGHQIANDCETIIQAIEFDDPAEKQGLNFLKELSSFTDKLSGDARKTTVILCEEILKLGYESKLNKLELKKQLDDMIPVIEKIIDEQTTKITPDEIGKVATTAGENAELGNLLQEIYQKIGVNGIIRPQGSGTYETSYKFIDGVRLHNTGLLSAYMVHDEEALKDKQTEKRAVYKNPMILVTKRKIMTDDDINPFLREMQMSDKKDLVIFTDDMDSGVASMLVNLHVSKRFNVCIIKAPVIYKNYVFEDFAKCVGATVIEDSSGVNFKSLNLNHLGTCDEIIVDEVDTVIIGTKDISGHIAHLKAKGDDDSKQRLAYLANKTVILNLGSNGESDLSYKRLKCADAIRSSELALHYGIVTGGGVGLLNVSNALAGDSEGNKILKEALKAPIKQIIKNAGYEAIEKSKVLGGKIWEQPKNSIVIDCDDFKNGNGYDAKKNAVVNMFDVGIVDASKVLKTAVRNAIGIASTILTANGFVYLPPRNVEKPKELNW